MHSADESVRLCKVEYLGDVFTSASAGSFAVQVLRFNPGVLLYWGSHFAALFQQWRLNGAMVYFRSRASSYTATTTLGTVMICMDYNSHNPDFTNKQQMQETAGCVACAIDQNCACGVECDTRQVTNPVKYVRTTALPVGEDYHLYDLGKLEIATQGCAASANIGELYISYDMTFYKPISQFGEDLSSCHYITTTGLDNTHNFGTAAFTSKYDFMPLGTIDYAANTINFIAGTEGTFLIEYRWHGALQAIGDFTAAFTLTNLTRVAILENGASSQDQTPTTGVSVDQFCVRICVKVTDPTKVASLAHANRNITATTTLLDIHINQLNTHATS